MVLLRHHEPSPLPEESERNDAHQEQLTFLGHIEKLEDDLLQASKEDDAVHSGQTINALSGRLLALHNLVINMDPEDFVDNQESLKPQLRVFQTEVKQVHIKELLDEVQTLRGRLRTYTEAVPASSINMSNIEAAGQRLGEFELLLDGHVYGKKVESVADLEDRLKPIRELFDYIPRS